MRTVSSPELHTLELLVLQDQKTPLQAQHPVNPTAHHRRAQVLLRRSRKARPKVAVALQVRDLLMHRMPVLKVIPTVKVAHGLQARDPLGMLDLKAILTMKAVHRLQVRRLLGMLDPKVTRTVKAVHRLQARGLLGMLDLKATLTVRTARRLQGQVIRQQHPSSHRLSNQRHKVAHRK